MGPVNEKAGSKSEYSMSSEEATPSHNIRIRFFPDESAIFLPTEVLLSNPISVKQDEIVRQICKPTTPLLEISEFAVKEWQAGAASIELQFEENVSISQQQRWSNMVSPIVSAICRELSGGKFQAVVANGTALYFEAKTCAFISTREVLVDYLIKNVQNGLLEFTYSPKSIPGDSMEQIMKNFEPIKQEIERHCGQQLGSLRKAGEFKTFSFLIALFSLESIGEHLKHGRHFFSSLVFSQELIEARDIVEQRLKAYAVNYTLPCQITALRLSFFSEIMSIENEQMKDYMLVKTADESEFELELVRADELYIDKCADLYAYLVACFPAIYKAQIQLIYSGTVAGTRHEVPQELIDEIVDQAIEQYIFDKDDLIDVQLDKFSSKIPVEWLSEIAAQIQDELLGEDNCKFGSGLDGEPFIKIFKMTREI